MERETYMVPVMVQVGCDECHLGFYEKLDVPMISGGHGNPVELHRCGDCGHEKWLSEGSPRVIHREARLARVFDDENNLVKALVLDE